MESGIGFDNVCPSLASGKQTCEESFCQKIQAIFISLIRELLCSNCMEDKSLYNQGDYLGSRPF